MSQPSLSKRLRKLSKPIRHWLLTSLLKAMLWTIGFMPLRWNIAIGRGLGRLGSYLAVGEFQKVLRHLELALGDELSADERRKLARDHFAHLGQVAFEVLSYRRLTRETVDDVFSYVGKDVMSEAFENGKGVILVSAHCGNWEWMGAGVSLAGYPFNVIVRENPTKGLAPMLDHIRKSWDMKTYHRSPFASAKEALRVLRRNEALAMLTDQDTRVDSIWVDFFGHPAATPVGPAVLHLRTGSPIVHVDMHRTGVGTYQIEFIRLDDGELKAKLGNGRNENIRLITQRMVDLHEEMIRAKPAEWVWLHERWRRKPKAENDGTTDGHG